MGSGEHPTPRALSKSFVIYAKYPEAVLIYDLALSRGMTSMNITCTLATHFTRESGRHLFPSCLVIPDKNLIFPAP
jgi:hypothetical protein